MPYSQGSIITQSAATSQPAITLISHLHPQPQGSMAGKTSNIKHDNIEDNIMSVLKTEHDAENYSS